MTKTILDYIEAKVENRDPKLAALYIELVHKLAVQAAENFMKLYGLVEESSDNKLKLRAQRLFGKTVVDIAAYLNEINKIEKQLFQGDRE